ncbi:MAG: hypothetical protein MK135_15440, partial [Polyangiaceae bacterium]|nr:hypothetical protein [Polyangiaceae bacterium]
TTLATRVPLQSPTLRTDDPSLFLVIDSSAPDLGTLAELENNEIKKRATDVFASTLRRIDAPKGVAYLKENGSANSGRLEVWLENAGFSFDIHPKAHEYRLIPWPSAGILYSVRGGTDAGIWFSKAR